ncbi:MAG: metal ABC transporter permease [Vulcanimicrobiota bacterium]
MFEVFQFEFMRYALASSLLIGLTCSYLGLFVVLRKIIFVGIALAQISALGVAVAIFTDQNPTLFALLFTIVGVLIFAPNYGGRRLSPEAIIGVGFAASWAIAILVLSKAAHGEANMLNLVRGNVLSAGKNDLAHLLAVFIPVTIMHVFFYKNFLFTSFDPEMASTLNISSQTWNFLFYLSLGLVVAISIKVAGVLLTFSFLLLPAVTALMMGNNMRTNIILTLVSAVIAAFIGLVISFQADLPTGPTVVGVSFAIFILTMGTVNVLRFFNRRKIAVDGS